MEVYNFHQAATDKYTPMVAWLMTPSAHLTR